MTFLLRAGSYNALNGIPTCADPWLLQTVARDSWKFEGYVTSDCDADSDVFVSHNYTATATEAVGKILHAGTDLDCGGFVEEHALQSLAAHTITLGDIEQRITNLFRVRLRLGHFDPPGPLQQIAKSDICSDEALEIARSGAIQGTVLLKNLGKRLPLEPAVTAGRASEAVNTSGGALQKVTALIGPNVNLSKSIAGYYGGKQPCGSKFWSMIDAISQYTGPEALRVLKGVPTVTSNDTSTVGEAVAAAHSADDVILVVGQDGTIEHEASDRTKIALSQGQTELIARVADAAIKPVVVVILTGGAVDVSEMLANSRVGAVLMAGQPSVTVLGVGDLIYGKAVPSGRMVQTTYPASFVNEVSIFDMGMRPGPSPWPAPGQIDCGGTAEPACKNGTNPGRTHRFYSKEAVVPFGFGLSYSSFRYTPVLAPATVSLSTVRHILARATKDAPSHRSADDVRSNIDLVRSGDNTVVAEYFLNVTNTGDRDADDSVLGFLKPPGGGTNGIPLQSLFAFERVHVAAGATVQVYLAAHALDFTVVGQDGSRTAWPGGYQVQFGVVAPKGVVGIGGVAQGHNMMGFASVETLAV